MASPLRGPHRAALLTLLLTALLAASAAGDAGVTPPGAPAPGADAIGAPGIGAAGAAGAAGGAAGAAGAARSAVAASIAALPGAAPALDAALDYSVQNAPLPGAAPPGSSEDLMRLLRRRADMWTWDARNLGGIALAFVISLLSSVDRECGAALYLVMFSVLLEFSLRQAIALTAFCTFLGSLGPAVAATSEAVLTERGVRAAADYATAVVILPAMFYGISWGVIVNAVLPSWLLAILIAAHLAISAAELAAAVARMALAKRAMVALARRIKAGAQGVAFAAGGGGDLLGAAHSFVAPAGATGAPGARARAGGAPAAAGQAEDLGALRRRMRRLHRGAAQIEAVALLFPALHVPTHQEVARLAKTDVDTLFGEGHGLSRHHGGGAAAAGAFDGAKDAERAVDAGGALDGADPAGECDAGGNPVPLPPLPEGRCGGLRRWASLQGGFEWALIFKIVVLHLLTEFLRHDLAKPCTRRFWNMLIFTGGLVTLLLCAMAASYNRRRLWRGPRFAEAAAAAARERELGPRVVDLAAEEEAAEAAELAAAAEAAAADAAAAAAAEEGATGGGGGGGRAVKTSRSQAERLGHAMAARHGSGGVGSGGSGGAAPPPQRGGCAGGCCAGLVRFWRGHSPFLRNPPAAAVQVDGACLSADGYRSWRVWRIVAVEAVSFPIGVFGCAIGMPGGTLLSWLMLWLRIKPHVVAATSRWLVSAFTLGTFVAYIISGNLRYTYALGYGIINLVVAPMGVVLFRRAALPSTALLSLSLAMGIAATGAFAGGELVPAVQHLAGRLQGTTGFNPLQDGFKLWRFCKGHHVPYGGAGAGTY